VSSPSLDRRPLVAHIVHRFDVGGLENGVVSLINRLPADRFRHAVIALTEVGEFRRRVQREDVQFHALHKPPGQGLRVAPKLVRLLRQIKPSLVHTRNLGALEMALPAWWAGVPLRVHGEHGWDSHDPDGRSLKCRLVRRAYRPFVHRYVALSRQLQGYLIDAVGVPPARIAQIYNGVDTQRFVPAEVREPISGCPFGAPHEWLVGWVGRMEAVKDPVNLVQAFATAVERSPAMKQARLVLVGDGRLRGELQRLLREAGLSDRAWLPGERSDVPAILRGLDCFVLPSLAEGISNTILEAMASGLPVVATRVGGLAEVVADGETGRLVAPGRPDQIAAAVLEVLAQRARMGAAARERAQRFGADAYADRVEAILLRVAGR